MRNDDAHHPTSPVTAGTCAAFSRVLLVDDHAAVRAALRAVIGGRPNLQIVAEAEDGLDAVRLARDLSPDLVIMDLSMPRLNGVEATRQIVSADPQAKVIALSTHADLPVVRRMLQAGAVAYVLKERAVIQIGRAIDAALAGATYVSPKLAAALDPIRPGEPA
jgi:DNA-binding NarL/FixJ family response regulator